MEAGKGLINQAAKIPNRTRAIVLALFVLSLTACTSSPEPLPPPTLTTAPSPVAMTTPSATDTLAAPTDTPALPTATATVPAPTDTPLPATDTPAPSATPTASPTATTTPTAIPAAPDFVVSNAVANVRAGPGTDYPIIGQVRQGETYAVTGRNASGSWWEFAFGQRTGWISASLVESNEQADRVQVSANIPPAPTATATLLPQPTNPPVAAASCPAWFQHPQPGMGVLVIENHDTGTVPARVEQIGTPNEWSLSQRFDDVPGRLTLQLSPGRHEFKIEIPAAGLVMIKVEIEAGKTYISPIVLPRPVFGPYGLTGFEGMEGVVYPLVAPPGC